MPTIRELEELLRAADAPVLVAPDGSVFVKTQEWPDPTPDMLLTPEFEAVWQVIKTWDIAVPGAYGGYCGATGNHVRAILDALPRGDDFDWHALAQLRKRPEGEY